MSYLSNKQRNKLQHSLNGNKIGSALGQVLGGLGSAFLPIPGVNGAQLGGALGSLLPFARGGRVVMIAPGPPQMRRGGKAKKGKKKGGKK